MDRLGLSRGVRYELGRLVSAGKLRYGQLTEEALLQLQGPNQEAVPKISEVFFGEKSPHSVDMESAFANEIAAHVRPSSITSILDYLSHHGHSLAPLGRA